jgi:phage I-like protein
MARFNSLFSAKAEDEIDVILAHREAVARNEQLAQETNDLAAQVQALQQQVQALQEQMAATETALDASLVEEAVALGRIVPAERDAWLTRLASNCEERKILAALPAGTRRQRGVSPPSLLRREAVTISAAEAHDTKVYKAKRKEAAERGVPLVVDAE